MLKKQYIIIVSLVSFALMPFRIYGDLMPGYRCIGAIRVSLGCPGFLPSIEECENSPCETLLFNRVFYSCQWTDITPVACDPDAVTYPEFMKSKFKGYSLSCEYYPSLYAGDQCLCPIPSQGEEPSEVGVYDTECQ